MKWGVRRFQNPDGSYTSAGKNRYRTDSGGYKGTGTSEKRQDASKMSNEELRKANARYKLEKQYNENHAPANKVKTRLEAARSVSNDASNIANRTRELNERAANRAIKQRPVKRMDLRHMTDQELRDRINRGNLERQYTQLYGTPQEASGREKVAAVLDYAGTVLAIGGSAASIALTIHELKK